ncbi:PAS domain-containing sensor histidine kinase [Arenibacter latericius]|uniref:PAS domain-containing sensor histidine kinase n=1 Tax=Arenibacter latericius TaxID=86104 RepID=UPI0009FFCD36|nr:sensor histidine kinase [Arenibacter latericius]
MKAIMESTKNQVWTLDRNYNLIFYNSAYKEHRNTYYGNLPPIGESILDYPKDHENQHNKKEYYDRALSGEYFSMEKRVVLSKKVFYFELTYNPIRDKDKRVTGCSIYKRDVTHRVKTLRKLKASENSLLEAQEMANIGSWEWDVTKDEIKWSKQLYTIFGKDEKHFKPSYKALASLIHKDDRQDFKNLFEPLETEDSFNMTNRIVLEDGSIKLMRHMGKVYRNENNTVEKVTGTTQDLTLIEQSKKQLIRQYRELQNFVYIVSHNVRGPISTILSLLQLYDISNNSKKDEIVEMVGLTVNKLDSTIKDLNHSLSLKTFSKSDLERIELKKIIEDVLLLISSEIKKTNANIHVNFNASIHVYGLRSYYSNIFYNLIINALRFRSRDRELIINIDASSNSIGGIEITVSDNGTGMDLNDISRKRIFDMYGRLSGTNSGKGLGLYLVKVQVEALNGTIEVQSTLNEGTSFILNLPSYS